jgi:hypothetical protein
MSDIADIVITISKLAESSYGVELRFSATRPAQSGRHEEQTDLLEHDEVIFDFKALNQALAEERLQDYGALLFKTLLGVPILSKVYQDALTITKSYHLATRLRLFIDRSAPELHSLCWETLHQPAPDTSTVEYPDWQANPNFLAWDQNLLFSRYLFSSRYTPVEQRSKGELSALVVVANPGEMQSKNGVQILLAKDETRNLSSINVEEEIQRAKAALQDIKIEVFASQGDGSERVTLRNLARRLNNSYDILYLVCHGALVADDPDQSDSIRRSKILLEDDNGDLELVRGQELVDAINVLQPPCRPRLIVLASCQSAGGGTPGDPLHSTDGGELAALGPRLAEAGIPAVVAMQTDVYQDTLAQFMPVFFQELLKDGQVDRAMATARYTIKDREDWWAPVLYLRLREGLWYEPYFTGAEGDYSDLWEDVISNINHRKCVPILGFGLLEFLLGTSHDLARDLARAYKYPLGLLSIENFPQVAQYLTINYGAGGSRDRILGHIADRLREKYKETLQQDTDGWTLDQLLCWIGTQRWKTGSTDAYWLLASLPFEIYFTTNHDCLLEEALRAQDPPRQPQVMFSRWNSKLIDGEIVRRKDQKIALSPEQPVVYHLLGSLSKPQSMVLSEDDYFEYMMWVNNKSAPLPIPVDLVKAWREKSLLFLGYGLSDWSFRVLYRSILNEERRYGRDYKSVAVQLQPSTENLSPENARKFLEKYFPNDKFNIYWGRSAEFLKDLWARWSARGRTA